MLTRVPEEEEEEEDPLNRPAEEEEEGDPMTPEPLPTCYLGKAR